MKIFTELQSAQTLEIIKKEHRDLTSGFFIEGATIEKALELLFSLEEKLKSEPVRDKTMLSQYRDILVSLRVRLFSHLSDQKGYHFFKAHFISACTYDAIGEVSLFASIQHFLGGQDIMERDKMLQKIGQNVRQCTELVGKKNILLGDTKMPPQFRNWLRDYIETIGAGKKIVSDIREYLSRSSNARALNRSDRAILQRALKYYELIKVPTKEIGSLGNKPLLAWGFSPSEVEGIDEDLFDLQLPDQLLSQYETYDAFKMKSVIKDSSAAKSQPDHPVLLAKKNLPANPPTSQQNTSRKQPQAQQSESPQKISDTKPFTKPRVDLGKSQAPSKNEPIVEKRQLINTNTLSSPEQLAHLSIADFRGFGSTDEARIHAVSSKIKNLNQNNASLLTSWQQSPLYKLYLTVGRQSMTSDQSVSEIGRDLFKEGKPYVTEKEFEMIAELSSQF